MCRKAREQALRGGEGVGEGKGVDLIGQFLTSQQQRGHGGGGGGSWGGIQIYETSVQALLPPSFRKRNAGPRMS